MKVILGPVDPVPARRDLPPRVPSLVVFVRAHGRAHILYRHGDDVEHWIEGVGIDGFAKDLEGNYPEAIADGVYVWTGHVKGRRDYWGEYDEEIVCDDIRPVTAEEWALFCDDEHAWHLEEIRAREAWEREAAAKETP